MSKSPKQQKPDEEDKSSRTRQIQDYAKYSGMAIQMGIIILAGTYLGKKLDEYFQTERPLLTVLCALISIFLALYLSLKDLLKNEKD